MIYVIISLDRYRSNRKEDNNMDTETILIERDKIVARFMDNGALTHLPTKKSKLALLYDYLANDFEHNKNYTEAEVNVILIRRFTDYATLRRGLIDHKLMERKDGIYTRTKNPLRIE